jgi:hypothetical protein
VSGPETKQLPLPPRFLADEHIGAAIVRGARRKRPALVFLAAKEAGTLHLGDPELLERAKELGLILVTHDSATMYDHFAAFLMGLGPSEHCPGVFVVSQERYSIGQIIDFIVEIYDLSTADEWIDRIVRLPL